MYSKGGFSRSSFVVHVAAAALVLFAVAQLRRAADGSPAGGERMSFTLSSPAFEAGETIPVDYTCDGRDVSPPLRWGSTPAGTVTLALICDDPDAPVGTWVHWVVYNIPSSREGFDEAVPPEERLPDGTLQGRNDFGRIGYGGPCPPGGTHRYFFKLYALDTKLDLPPGARKDNLLRAMKGHVLAESELMGRYGR